MTTKWGGWARLFRANSSEKSSEWEKTRERMLEVASRSAGKTHGASSSTIHCCPLGGWMKKILVIVEFKCFQTSWRFRMSDNWPSRACQQNCKFEAKMFAIKAPFNEPNLCKHAQDHDKGILTHKELLWLFDWNQHRLTTIPITARRNFPASFGIRPRKWWFGWLSSQEEESRSDTRHFLVFASSSFLNFFLRTSWLWKAPLLTLVHDAAVFSG